jgi:hypothetical protein
MNPPPPVISTVLLAVAVIRRDHRSHWPKG